MQDGPAPGPVDVVVIEFPNGADTTEAASELEAVLDRGTVQLFDIVAIRKRADGHASEVQIAAGGSPADGFARFSGARSRLFDSSDLEQVAAILAPDTTAVMIAYENTWARGFVGAAHAAGGAMIASEHIPAQVLLDALDSAESAT